MRTVSLRAFHVCSHRARHRVHFRGMERTADGLVTVPLGKRRWGVVATFVRAESPVGYPLGIAFFVVVGALALAASLWSLRTLLRGSAYQKEAMVEAQSSLTWSEQHHRACGRCGLAFSWRWFASSSMQQQPPNPSLEADLQQLGPRGARGYRCSSRAQAVSGPLSSNVRPQMNRPALAYSASDTPSEDDLLAVDAGLERHNFSVAP